MDILIVDDEKIICDAASQIIEGAGHYAESARSSAMALESLKTTPYDLVLLDLNLGRDKGLEVLAEIQKRQPSMPVVIFTATGTVNSAVEAMRLGALDYLQKPFTSAQLGLVLARVQKHRKLAQRVVELETQMAGQSPGMVFETEAPLMRVTLDVLFRAASTPASILLLGESGTGKSVVARAVHRRSARISKPFVTVNCPSLSKELLESELFGHLRGSFTGAMRDHWGKVKAAEGGTLFLDEIGEMPLEIQPKLLRLLQEREYERLGESTTRQADVRIIAATNRDLSKAVAAGTFREDLFYRLNVITVEIPALRQRPADLMTFAERYLQFFACQCGRPVSTFSAEADRCLRAHSWPGNLRELRNAIERAVILSAGGEIDIRDLPAAVVESGLALIGPPATGDLVTLEALEAAHIQSVVTRTSSLTQAAQVLGIDQATLYRKRKKLGSGG